MKKFQVRQTGPIRLTSAVTPAYASALEVILCIIGAL
jgi:hypothetical protein